MGERPGIRHLLLAVLLAAAVGAVLARGRHLREDPGAVLAALRLSAGPRLPEAAVAGAESATAPSRHERETLHELVNGAAEAYLSRGFERCLSALYAFPGGLEVAAEAHRFSAEEGARAQLEAERPRTGRPVEGGVSDGSVLLAVRGRDLLKLTSLTPDPRGGEALLALAAAWRKETAP
jgi:hypothetical protein